MDSEVTELLEQLIARAISDRSSILDNPPWPHEFAAAHEAVQKYEAMTVDEARAFLQKPHDELIQHRRCSIEEGEARLTVLEKALPYLQHDYGAVYSPAVFHRVQREALQFLQNDISGIRSKLVELRKPPPPPEDPEKWLDMMRYVAADRLRSLEMRGVEATRRADARAEVLARIQREFPTAPIKGPEPEEERHEQ